MFFVHARALRLTVASIAAGIILASIPHHATPPAAAQASPRPNFVIVLTDDQRWDTIGRCLNGFDGDDLDAGSDACMPFLQQDLTARGTTFKRGYVTTSLCCPARTSLLTGLYARRTGVLDNQSLDLFSDTSTLATWLDDAGYRTGLIGKYTNGYGEDSALPPNYVPPGWDSWHSFWGRPNYTRYSLVHREPGSPATTTAYEGDATAPTPCQLVVYSTDRLCRYALDFLQSDTQDPFFLLFAPYAPHLEPIEPSRYRYVFRQDVTLPEYPNYNRVPEPNPPSYLPKNPLSTTLQSINGYGFRAMLRANLAVDDAIHQMREQLAVDGRLENTVWIYLSDNGLARTEHRWHGKACEYEECHKVPFVVVCPEAVCPGATPGNVDTTNAVLNIDLAPTITELAGLTAPFPMDGRSLVPLLSGTPVPWRSWFLLEDHGLRPSNRPLGIVSTLEDGHTYKFVRFQSAASDLELFDLTADPWEIHNLAFDPAYGSIRARLEQALDAAINAPTVSITVAPPAQTSEVNAHFEWASDQEATFECALDGAVATPCGAGTSGSIDYPGLTQGTHSFSVWGTDADGGRGEPATWTFTIGPPSETLPPPTFTGTPHNPGTPDATFSFTHTDPAATFSCALDGAAFASCASPHSLSGLSGGMHEFQVVARRGASVSDPISYSWSVDAGDPVVTITSDADRFMIDTKIGVVWTGSDDVGVVRYDVFQRNGTRGTQQLVASTTEERYVHNSTPGTTSCYQVVAIDGAGRRGTSDEVCRAVPHDDRDPSLVYSGPVSAVDGGGSFLSTVTTLTGPGSEVQTTFNGRRYGILLRQDPTSGMADVYLDGALIGRIDGYAPNTRWRSYVVQEFVTDGPHTLRLVWTGERNPSSSGTGVAIDGIATLAWGA